MRFRRLSALVLSAAMVATVPVSAAHAGTKALKKYPKKPAGISAQTGYLLDQTTGKVLWSRKPNTKMQIGSITKVMTALVVLKAGKLNRKIKITQRHHDYIDNHGASSAGLVVGDTLTAGQLVQAMLLESDSAAAYALADAYGPTWKKFIGKMNAQAKALHLTHTRYDSFDGLNPWWYPNKQWSTAKDQVTLARTAMKYPNFRNTVAKKQINVWHTPGGHSYTFDSGNKLLGRYPGMLGIKTGTTGAAGACFLFASKNKKHLLYGVVLKSTNNRTARFNDTVKILNWAFHLRAKVTVTREQADTA
ncbi:MAG: serine hydrolase [Streptosporangiaceae bacterium]